MPSQARADEGYNRFIGCLTEISCGFCMLAMELWCQKSHLVVMKNDALFTKRFSVQSSLHQPHITMGLDDEDRSFDGAFPQVILVPAVCVVGDVQGKNLQQSKIIFRSVVLIYKELLPSAPNLTQLRITGPSLQVFARQDVSPKLSESNWRKRNIARDVESTNSRKQLRRHMTGLSKASAAHGSDKDSFSSIYEGLGK